jgi:hypothetical protein
VLMMEFMQQGTTRTLELYCVQNTKKKPLQGHSEQKAWNADLRCSMTMRVRIQLFELEQSWSISTGSCLTTLLTTLISRQAIATCLPTCRNGWDHSTSTTIRS